MDLEELAWVGGGPALAAWLGGGAARAAWLGGVAAKVGKGDA
jgi:hypothetical protein